MTTATIDVGAEPGKLVRPPRLILWYAWLIAFYATWFALLELGDHWPETRAHWPIALAMALGSFVAGSTPMGGGTVGFPVLVLLFDFPASIGRNFGLAIQSIGMTSAAIFILCRRIPIETRSLVLSIPASAVGLIVGTYLVVPVLPDTWVKLIFACLWMSFGVLTLAKNREFCAFDRVPTLSLRRAAPVGVCVGFVGGVTTSLTGVGVDMLLYTVLILLYRMDLKVAVPTSVIVMAISSLMGSALHFWIGDFDRELFYNWAAAAPVVILGAPLGALFVSVIPRVWTLYFVALLCVAQFLWTLHQVNPSITEGLFVMLNLAIALAGLTFLYQLGRPSRSQRGDVVAESRERIPFDGRP